MSNKIWYNMNKIYIMIYPLFGLSMKLSFWDQCSGFVTNQNEDALLIVGSWCCETEKM